MAYLRKYKAIYARMHGLTEIGLTDMHQIRQNIESYKKNIQKYVGLNQISDPKEILDHLLNKYLKKINERSLTARGVSWLYGYNTHAELAQQLKKCSNDEVVKTINNYLEQLHGSLPEKNQKQTMMPLPASHALFPLLIAYFHYFADFYPRNLANNKFFKLNIIIPCHLYKKELKASHTPLIKSLLADPSFIMPSLPETIYETTVSSYPRLLKLLMQQSEQVALNGWRNASTIMSWDLFNEIYYLSNLMDFQEGFFSLIKIEACLLNTEANLTNNGRVNLINQNAFLVSQFQSAVIKTREAYLKTLSENESTLYSAAPQPYNFHFFKQCATALNKDVLSVIANYADISNENCDIIFKL